MPSIRQLTIAAGILVTLVACGHDRRREYLGEGDKAFAAGQYQEAIAQYKNAIKLAPRDGLPHYKLALAYGMSKPRQGSAAIGEYRRSVELLKGKPEYSEEYHQSLIRLVDLHAGSVSRPVDEIEEYCDELVRIDPNSFDTLRVLGELSEIRWGNSLAGDSTRADQFENDAREYYRRAYELEPGDPGVAIRLGALLQRQKKYSEAEAYYRAALDHTGKSQSLDDRQRRYQGYLRLYRLYAIEKKNAEIQSLLDAAIRDIPEIHDDMERLRNNPSGLAGERVLR